MNSAFSADRSGAEASSAAGGLSLDPGQSELVSALATSGARVQVALSHTGADYVFVEAK